MYIFVKITNFFAYSALLACISYEKKQYVLAVVDVTYMVVIAAEAREPCGMHALRTYSDNTCYLTLPMLRLLSSKAQKRKDFCKPSKLSHLGIHWIALAEFFQMSTHLPGFQSVSRFFIPFCICQISHQQHKD